MSKDRPSQSDIQPEGGSRPKATEDADVEGHMPFRRGVTEPGPDEPGAEDAEGHMPLRKVEPVSAPDEPDVDDTEGNGRFAKATEDPIEAEGMGRHDHPACTRRRR